jgi:hypothetical protein
MFGIYTTQKKLFSLLPYPAFMRRGMVLSWFKKVLRIGPLESARARLGTACSASAVAKVDLSEKPSALQATDCSGSSNAKSLAAPRSKNTAIATCLLLLTSLFAAAPIAANAAPDGDVACSDGGTFTIQSDIVISSSNCSGQITIPAGVSVGSTAFASSPNLGEIAFLDPIPTGSPWGGPSSVMVSRGISCGDSGYFVIRQTTVAARHNCTGSVVIPEGITQVGFAAFDADPGYGGVGHPNEGRYNNSSVATAITSLTIPSTVTSIGNFAFRNLQVSAVSIPDSVTSIGEAAFAGSSMTSLSIGNGLTTISPWVFAGLASLTSVTFGSGVRTIDERAFSDATALSAVTIPDSVELIGAAAFSWYHDNSPHPVRIPTLNYCGDANLTDTGLQNPASNATTCLPARPVILSATGGDGGVEIAFSPGSVEGRSPITAIKYSLNGGPFTTFSSQSTASPLSITGLANDTSYTVSLKAVSAIGEGAASRPITFVAGISAYSDPAIGGVTAPVTGETPVTLVTPTSGYTGTVTWSESHSTFKLATRYTATIQLIPAAGHTLTGVPANYFTISGAVSVTHATNSGLITAVFRTSGDGEISCGTSGKFMFSNYTITGHDSCIGSVLIPNAITAIAADGFSDAPGISSVNFAPGSELQTIGSGAFLINPNVASGSLTSITIPKSVTWIGNGAFQFSALSSLIFEADSSIQTIDINAFWGASLLPTVEIPNSLTALGEGAFRNATGLTSVQFEPESQLTEIPRDAFLGASSIASIVIPKSVGVIGESAFSGATGLTSVTFEEDSQLAVIGNGAFYGASALVTIEIPNGVSFIGAGSFEDATALTSVTFEAGSVLYEIGSNAFRGASSLRTIQIPNQIDMRGYAFLNTHPSLFASSYRSWKVPLPSISSGPRIGEIVFASAFERELSIPDLGGIPEEYVYRITRQENVAATSVDVQSHTLYHTLTKGEQYQWYEDMGFDAVGATGDNPYLFSWRAFMCVADVNGAVTLSKPGSLNLSYASRESVPSGSSWANLMAVFKLATQQLEVASSPSTRTVVGKMFDSNQYEPPGEQDLQSVNPSNTPYSFGISEVGGSCGSGKTLEALEIVDAGATPNPIASKSFTISAVLNLKYGGQFFEQDAAGVTIGVTGGGGPPPEFSGAYNAALWGLTTIAGTVIPSAPDAVVATPNIANYTGPLPTLFAPRILDANKAQTVRVIGERLDQVTRISHNGIAINFTIISAGEIEVRLPALLPGVKDIKFDSASRGTVTLLNAIEVRAEPETTTSPSSPVTDPPKPVTSSPVKMTMVLGFGPGSSRLNSAGSRNMSIATKRVSAAKEISCIGFTMGPSVLARDIQLSYNRALAVCNQLASSIPGAKVMKIEGRQDSRTGDRIRRVEIWWRD